MDSYSFDNRLYIVTAHKQISSPLRERIKSVNMKKRKISVFSSTEPKTIRTRHAKAQSTTAGCFLEDSDPAWTWILKDKAASLLRIRMEAVDEESQLLADLIKHFKASRDGGKISTHESVKAITECAKKYFEAIRYRSVLVKSYHPIAGHWVAMTEGLDCVQSRDYAMIDLFIQRYKYTWKRTKEEQQRFRKRVFKYYDTTKEPLAWCPIAQAHVYPGDMIATHIVDYNLDYANCAYLFGSREDHLMSPRNGLPICKQFEQLIDAGRITIVPSPENTASPPTEFQLLVLDPNLHKEDVLRKEFLFLRAYNAPLPTHIHGRRLKFLNKARPRSRYLYFSSLAALFWRLRKEVPGAAEDIRKYASDHCWTSPGEYLQQSTLDIMAQRIGHLEIFNELLGRTTQIRGQVEGRRSQDIRYLKSREKYVTNPFAGPILS